VAVLIDPPLWPAHGTRFSHLVSDTSLLELLRFADANDVPVRAFDHDHCDVPERRHADLVAAGAEPVAPSELLRRLVASGLRVRTPARRPKREAVLGPLQAAWAELMPGAPGLGDELLRRWTEPHRHYHDVRHLAQMLAALERLTGGTVPRPVALAAWFHDAVHAGQVGADEGLSAQLAETELPAAGVGAGEAAEVARLVRLTIDHLPGTGDPDGELLVDADLSILGDTPGRYHMYSRDVRLEYADIPDQMFAAGRLGVIHRLFSRDSLYRSTIAQRLWSVQARRNLAEERDRWSNALGQER
jgi:predicted metal-dependent HD superfamily phosphohydrolase